MKNEKTYYLLILDKSGSMHDCQEETISGFNAQLKMIKELEEKFPEQSFRISLTTFNQNVVHQIREEETYETKELDKRTYQPAGNTALLDAIGESLVRLNAKISHEIEKGEASVVVVIMTDGHENCSKLFTSEAIYKLIGALEKTGCWTFSYLGATPDALETASKLNIQKDNAAQFNKKNMIKTLEELSHNLKEYAGKKESGWVSKSFLKRK